MTRSRFNSKFVVEPLHKTFYTIDTIDSVRVLLLLLLFNAVRVQWPPPNCPSVIVVRGRRCFLFTAIFAYSSRPNTSWIIQCLSCLAAHIRT